MSSSLQDQRSQIISDLRELELIQYALAENDYALFFQAAWEVLEPETKLLWNWHHDLICEYLQAAELGQIKRLIINIAPRSTKSLLATVCFPAWTWIKRPSNRFLFGSFSGTLATKHSVLRRGLIESAWYQRGYGNRFKMASDVNTKADFANDKTGLMRASGINSIPTGEGSDYIVVDDPHAPSGAESKAERETVLQNFDLGWSTRLNDKKTGRIIVIMQRLHENDITGHLLERDLGYTHLRIPSIAEERQTIVFPITGRRVERAPDECMHPARDGPKELAQAKEDLGSYGFAGQHQQSPVPLAGGIIQRAWLKYYDHLPMDLDEKIISVDLSFKEGPETDFTVIECWGRKGANIYLIDQIRARMDFPAQITAIRTITKRYPEAFEKLIEEAANGAAIISLLKNEIMGLVAVKPKTSKEARLAAVSPLFEAGNVHYPNPLKNPWVEINLHELFAFPNSKNDDTVDTASQACSRLGGSNSSLKRMSALANWR